MKIIAGILALAGVVATAELTVEEKSFDEFKEELSKNPTCKPKY